MAPEVALTRQFEILYKVRRKRAVPVARLALDAPPIALHARAEKPEIVAGVRIGITKAIALPWRYGLKGSKFLSKPF